MRRIFPYENIVDSLTALETDSAVSSILISTGSSYSIYNAVSISVFYSGSYGKNSFIRVHVLVIKRSFSLILCAYSMYRKKVLFLYYNMPYYTNTARVTEVSFLWFIILCYEIKWSYDTKRAISRRDKN